MTTWSCDKIQIDNDVVVQTERGRQDWTPIFTSLYTDVKKNTRLIILLVYKALKSWIRKVVWSKQETEMHLHNNGEWRNNSLE